MKEDFIDIKFKHILDIEDFIFIGNDFLKVAIPANCPLSLKKNLLAGLLAHYQMYNSIDYVLKNYGDKWELGDDRSDLIFEISFIIKNEIIKTIKRFDEVENKPDRHGIFAAETCLIRLYSSFRANLMMIRQGFVFESSLVSRLILEQLAWAVSVYKLNEGVFNILPTKSISNLKKIIPYVGNLYGIFTKDAHITPSETKRYISVNGEIPQVILASSKSVKINANHLLLLTDAYLIVSEIIYSECLKKFSYIEKDSFGEFSPKKDRGFKKKIEEFRKELFDERK